MRRTRGEEEEENDEPEIPLHHKRPFGAGLKRKKIEFVRATESDPGLPSSSTSSAGKGSLVGDLYASIVLGEVSSQSGPASRTESPGAPTDDDDEQSREPIICPVCALPITTSLREHEASLAHQVSMTHSHPPSGLDRTRMGLRTLQSQGWDPDARRGLGLEGEGPRYPIKVAAKEDNLGIGASAQQANEDAKKKKKEKESEAPPRQLTAKERKALAAKERQRAERLQAEIYGRVDVEGYLRGNGADNAI